MQTVISLFLLEINFREPYMINKRVDYVDIIKGIVIFGVVWVHTACPNWLTALLVNSIFFFLSGIFFKRKPFNVFIREKVQSIIVPFLFFYLLSFLYRIIEHFWDNRTLVSFEWGCIFDVFKFVSHLDYLFVNVPLWFLLCLFSIQILYYFISFLDKRLIAVVVLLCFVFRDFTSSIPSFFMFNGACYYLCFFALGNLVGKPWIEKLKDIRFRQMSLWISILLSAILLIPIGGFEEWLYDICYHVKLLMVFFILMSIASWFNGKLSLIRYFGKKSLIILGFHVIPLIFLIRVTNAIWGYCTPFMGFIQSTIVMAVMYVVILFCNRYIPFLVGKKTTHL